MREGTIVDATIIAAPSSAKNARKERDPRGPRPRRATQWSFGMKAHIGVDAKAGLVHSVAGTAANVADSAQTHALRHGVEKAASADAGYLGGEKRGETAAGHAGIEWHMAAKRGKIKALAEGLAKRWRSKSNGSRRRCERGWSTPFISSRISSSIGRSVTAD